MKRKIVAQVRRIFMNILKADKDFVLVLNPFQSLVPDRKQAPLNNEIAKGRDHLILYLRF